MDYEIESPPKVPSISSELSEIRDAIESSGLKHGHIARRLGIHRTHLSHVLNGQFPLTTKLKTLLWMYLNACKT